MQLELLAPARNLEIGIAAIDCGADAVYIAGPAYGAREAAGNPVSDIAALVEYAHKYSARVYVTINTLLNEDEYISAQELIWELYRVGVDALIIQDFNITKLQLPPVELHASTQAVCRGVEQAKMLESLGFTRLVLERQLSLDEIRAIRASVKCELEAFVHGALCVSYSGECFLSEKVLGRSANRGACAQPCRSKYDLVDANGKVLVRNRPLLSLKDFKLDAYIGALAQAGVVSFKIEGRLKSVSYVKNIVRHYRTVIDSFISQNPQYTKSSIGELVGGFNPNPDITFNRGYTHLFVDGEYSQGWNSADAAKSMGERLGKIKDINRNKVTIETKHPLSNGDGLAFVVKGGAIVGMRTDLCSGNVVTIKDSSALSIGDEVWRNYNIAFEKELASNMPKRIIDAYIEFSADRVVATSIDGLQAVYVFEEDYPVAEKRDRALLNITNGMSKSAGVYHFSIKHIDEDDVRFYPISTLNSIRRELADRLDAIRSESMVHTPFVAKVQELPRQTRMSDELMRTRYCIKRELGLCAKFNAKAPKVAHPLSLLNNGRRFQLHFDCEKCEMVVKLG